MNKLVKTSIIIFGILLILSSCEKTTPPKSAFTVNETAVLVDVGVSFTDQSSNDPKSWRWDFGDGSNSTEQHPGHTYTQAGIYTVGLTVSNDGGSDTETKTGYITVSPVPVPDAEFTADVTSLYKDEDVVFTDQSTNTPTSWNWDFGDGSNSTEQHPVHTYTQIGTYTVSLTVSNEYDSDTETKTDYISVSTVPVPEAGFIANVTIAGLNGEITFTDQSTNSPTSWSWNFGDGTASTEQNPVHAYIQSGTYTVSLLAGNDYGSDTETKTDYITIVDGAVDIDGNVYETVSIGTQEWMAENLKVTHYPNGDAIPFYNNSDFGLLSSNNTDDGAGVYGVDSNTTSDHIADSNFDTYGVLYSYAAATGDNWERDNDTHVQQGVCPDGWHLPSDAEWKTLEMELGMASAVADEANWRGANEGSQLAGNSGLWTDGVLEADSEFNGSGFIALPGAARFYNGSFSGVGMTAYLWSMTENGDSNVWVRVMNHSNTNICRLSGFKCYGFSVRCVKD